MADKNNNEDEAIMMDNGDAISSLEIKRIREAVERSDIEKFHLFTRLMRIHLCLKMQSLLKNNP